MIKAYNAKQWEIPLLMDGRKTVTRRCVKPKSRNACGFYVTFRKSDNAFMGVYDYDENERQFDNSQSPPYQPEDILYVRETWCQTKNGMYWYKADNICNGCTELGDCLPKGVKKHKTCELCEYLDGHDLIKWRPSIHMPKEAARIWLKVTDVRVERLQNITGTGILAEGVKNGKSNPAMGKRWENMQRIEFENLWDSTLKKSDLDRYGWGANPWVWVIEFERCEKPESEE